MLVRYGCGCVGFPPVQHQDATYAVMLYDCKSSPSDVFDLHVLGASQFDGQKGLSFEDSKRYINRVSRLAYDGHRGRTVAELLAFLQQNAKESGGGLI